VLGGVLPNVMVTDPPYGVNYDPEWRNAPEATAFVSDLYKLAMPKATSLIDLCKSTAIIDEETDRDRTILFNSSQGTFAWTRGNWRDAP